MKLLKTIDASIVLLFLLISILLLTACDDQQSWATDWSLFLFAIFYGFLPIIGIIVIALLAWWSIKKLKEQPSYKNKGK